MFLSGANSHQPKQQPQQQQQRTSVPTVMIPSAAAEWKVQMPDNGGEQDDQFGSCRSIESTYERIKQIGEGTYGQVYLAKDIRTNELVALKKIRMDNEKEGFPITAIREIKLLSQLDHVNVIRLREIVRSRVHMVNNYKGSIYMVCDYMDHDLTGLMERRNYKFTLPQIKCYMKQLLNGLAYCHKQQVLHRDLKASNLLINNQGILKLADFGLARPFKESSKDGKLTTRVITLWYRPPELILGSENYGPEVDVWSVGCILAELLLGKPLFPGKDEADQLSKISMLLGAPNEQNMPCFRQYQYHHLAPNNRPGKSRLRELYGPKLKNMPGAIELLEHLLVMDPAKRISAHDALFNPIKGAEIKSGFFYSDPLPCYPHQLPKFEASHEMDMKARRHAAKEAAQGRHPPASAPDAKRQRYMGPAGQAQHPAAQQGHRLPPQGAPGRRTDGAAPASGGYPPGDRRYAAGGGGAYGQAGPSGQPAEPYRQHYGGDRGPGGSVPPPAGPPGRQPFDSRGAAPPPHQPYGGGAGYSGRDAPPPVAGFGAAPGAYRGGPPPPTQYPASAPQPAYAGYAPAPYGQAQAGGYGGGAGAGAPGAGAAAAAAYGSYNSLVQAQLGPNGAAAAGAAPGARPPPQVQAGRPPPQAGGADWSSQRR